MKFTQIPLIEPLQRALKEEEYEHPTPIQEQAIMPLLEGKDLLGIAQTGTGKTAAFTLPLLQRMWEEKKVSPRKSPRALILAPTRELAAQIGDSIKAYGRHLRLTHTVIFGGVGQNPQVTALNRGVDILVATPGRLLDLMQQRHVYLDAVEFFVLDEADRMLDMGFIHDVKKIIAVLPRKRQSLFFSATMAGEVDTLARSMLVDPVKVEVTPQATTVERIDQKVLWVNKGDKEKLLLELLEGEHLERVLVFTRTKHIANKIAQNLDKAGIRADAIHGNKSQSARTMALKGFKSGKVRVLVATDIAARGIDVDGISHVINYELPNEPESYVHRIGRTARAGADGTAYSLVCAEEKTLLHMIEKLTQTKIPVMEHARHDEASRLATGAAARLPPRGAFQQKRAGAFQRFSKPRSEGRSGTKPARDGARTGGPRKSFGGPRRGPPRGGRR
jgi:ATP-dependent RNA helicase RhlE